MPRLRIHVMVAVLLGCAASAHAASPAKSPAPAKPHFDFLYSQGLGTRISTYDSTLTRDEVIDPDTTIHFVLPKADLDSIYTRMVEIHFFDMQEPHPVWPPNCPGGYVPNMQIRLEATLGKKSKQLEWSTDKVPCIAMATGDWQNLWDLEHLILRILWRQPEFQALPQPQGSYR
ncbi:MAG TPA: hypothetical protein VGR66_06760 [Candidatus Eisenbacteria bacterium]|jgi:hypothetical protein|nr:hypothetical protein [Candidatus Eisenbacteria bacterium]